MIKGNIISGCCHSMINADENGNWYCMECGEIVRPKQKTIMDKNFESMTIAEVLALRKFLELQKINELFKK